MTAPTGNLTSFKSRLENIVGDNLHLRPFVCDGNPVKCAIFIVGINPATELSQPFWSFWDDQSGFNKPKWYDVYRTERANKPLKAGKTRRNAISPTRRIIDLIVENVSPHKVLETNLHSKATSSRHELMSVDQQTDIFDFLLSEIKPKIIVLHGKETHAGFTKLYPCALRTDTFSKMSINGNEVAAFATSHFSRGFSRDKAKKIAESICSHTSMQSNV